MTDEATAYTHKAQWLDALTRYPKGSGCLCHVDTSQEPPVPEYCCLGVLAVEDGTLMIKDRRAYLLQRHNDTEELEWQEAEEAEEVYRQHPALAHEVQGFLAALNDCSQTFDQLVIPAIEALLEDDLTLKPQHRTDLLRFFHSQVLTVKDDGEKLTTCTGVIARLQEGDDLGTILADLGVYLPHPVSEAGS